MQDKYFKIGLQQALMLEIDHTVLMGCYVMGVSISEI